MFLIEIELLKLINGWVNVVVAHKSNEKTIF